MHLHQDADPGRRAAGETVDQWAFADAVEVDTRGRGPALRAGPALAAAVAAVVVVAGAAIIPRLRDDPLGAATGTRGMPGQTGQIGQAGQTGPAAPGGTGQAVPGGMQQQPPVSGQPAAGPGTSGHTLSYANQVIIGPGASCCWTSGGTWSPSTTGGHPAYGGPARISADPSAWFEWDLGDPVGGSRWDQVKIRVWIPRTQAGAWVRVTVTSTAGGASNVTSFDVAEQEYQGWYELPATFTLGTPDRRTGSAWVRMTYLRPYADPAADSTCADGSCRRMAAAQAEFLWS